nr:MAG TPA: hypothetical protein [Caudoviricetes sp.]
MALVKGLTRSGEYRFSTEHFKIKQGEPKQ